MQAGTLVAINVIKTCSGLIGNQEWKDGNIKKPGYLSQR